MTYLISNIKEISCDKIIYCDNDNIEQEIILLECSENWIEHFNNHTYVTWEGNPAPKISVEDNNCVGVRDWFAKNPYFEFFSNPKIRFEIRPKKRIFDLFIKNWTGRYYKEFRRISIDLQRFGWTTFDLG